MQARVGRSGWSDEETRALMDAAHRARAAGRPLREVFDAAAFKVKVIEEVKPEKGCGSNLVSVSAATAIAGAGILTLGILLLRKQKKS